MASIRKLANGRFQVLWRWPRGRQGTQHSTTCGNRRSAQAIRAEIEHAIELGREPRPGLSQADPDLEVMFTAYLQDRLRALNPKTVVRHGEALDLFVQFLRARRPRGRLTPDLLTRSALSDFWSFCTRQGGRRGPLGPATANRRVSQVLGAWRWLWDSDDYEDLVGRPRAIELRRVPEKEVVAPTWEEMDLCIESARGWHRQLAVVLRFTGLRVAQVMGIQWKDVDLKNASIRIRVVKGRERPRTIPISSHLVEELAGWGLRQGWLVDSGRQKGPREREARARDMARAWARAGVRDEVWAAHGEHRHGKPHHAFRAGFISGLRRRKADHDAVEWLAGHRLPGVTGGHYLDVSSLPLREAVDLIPGLTDPTRVDVVLMDDRKGAL